MKAIQLRILPATNTLPTRLKVWAEQTKPMIFSVECNKHNRMFAAKTLAGTWYKRGIEYNINGEHSMVCYDSYNEQYIHLVDGQLPNGEYCFVSTLKECKE